MKKIFYCILISLTLWNCKNSNEKIEFENLRVNETFNIVESIIIQDSLKVTKNGKDKSYFLENLKKLIIIIPKKEKKGIETIPLPFFNNVEIKNLINRKINNRKFFTEKDSLNIINQNEYPENLKLNKRILTKINSISFEEAKVKYKKENLDLYEMSIPIFSSNNKKAYVQLNNHCGRLCGEGIEIFLEKINGKWKIIFKQGTWVS
ncbi:hypothetical protein SL057_002439 [Flavobacterium psychrophilum]|nr:hypothetical protein [Flavobacterium psychrophilum]